MEKFISVNDVDDIDSLVKSAIAFKHSPHKNKNLGKGKRLGCLFLNPSMRTRLSTQIAAQNLGMEVIVFNVGQEGWALEFDDDVIMNGSSVEHVKDAAPVLGKYFDVLAVRTFPSLHDRAEDYSEQYINKFIQYAGVPVISLESATLHPLQSLADLVTIKENLQKKHKKPKIVLTWAPHVKPLPQCVANSFAEWVNAWGHSDFIITHPEGYELDRVYTKGATIITNQDEALENADFIYVKNWSSYKDYGKMLPANEDWMLTNNKLLATNKAKVMHCLPVRRNVELSDEVLDGSHSLVTEQAGNRVYAAQAVLKEILKGINQ